MKIKVTHTNIIEQTGKIRLIKKENDRSMFECLVNHKCRILSIVVNTGTKELKESQEGETTSYCSHNILRLKLNEVVVEKVTGSNDFSIRHLLNLALAEQVVKNLRLLLAVFHLCLQLRVL